MGSITGRGRRRRKRRGNFQDIHVFIMILQKCVNVSLGGKEIKLFVSLISFAWISTVRLSRTIEFTRNVRRERTRSRQSLRGNACKRRECLRLRWGEVEGGVHGRCRTAAGHMSLLWRREGIDAHIGLPHAVTSPPRNNSI